MDQSGMSLEASGRLEIRVSPYESPHLSSLHPSPTSTRELGTERIWCGVPTVWWNLSWDAQLMLKGSSDT